MCGGGGSSGPSAAELQAVARQEAANEMAKIKAEQAFEKQKFDSQMAFEREQNTYRQNELKTKAELDRATQQADRDRVMGEEQKKMEEEMLAQQALDDREKGAQSQSLTASQRTAAADAARRKTFLESFWYLDQDEDSDVNNQSVQSQRGKKSKASAGAY